MDECRSYQRLKRSCKGLFPFRIGTTSFIYPADYLPNVERLAPFLDEIELLLFEGRRAEQLPGRRVIRDLSILGNATGLTYNIHLPTDVDLGDPDKGKRQEAVEAIRRAMERTAPLSPTIHTLHLPWPGDEAGRTSPRRLRLEESLSALIASGISPRSLSIETLDYPFEWAAPLIHAMDLSVCLDLGHLMVHGQNLQDHFHAYGENTAILHLHGVKDGRDHLALDCLSPERWKPIAGFLKKFRGSVSLEVFSFDRLAASIEFMEMAFLEKDEKPGIAKANVME